MLLCVLGDAKDAMYSLSSQSLAGENATACFFWSALCCVSTVLLVLFSGLPFADEAVAVAALLSSGDYAAAVRPVALSASAIAFRGADCFASVPLVR